MKNTLFQMLYGPAISAEKQHMRKKEMASVIAYLMKTVSTQIQFQQDIIKMVLKF